MSLKNGLRVLDFLASQGEGAGLVAIADALSLRAVRATACSLISLRAGMCGSWSITAGTF